jgi:hypothetical protein
MQCDRLRNSVIWDILIHHVSLCILAETAQRFD